MNKDMERIKENMNILKDCILCPRNCHADRLGGQRGRCHETAEIVAARAALHMWEEPCISGDAGSGAVFFSGCSMGCIFCQNHNIAEAKAGKIITIERLSQIFLELQGEGAANINLVTPTHYVPQIIEALEIARKAGLDLPVVYNTSGYEKPETIQMLDGYVDVYLPDFKYMEPELAAAYSKAPDYPEYAKASLKEMISSDGEYPDQQRNRNDTKRSDRKTSGSAGACKKFQSGHKISARNLQRPDSDQHYESIHPYAAGRRRSTSWP